MTLIFLLTLNKKKLKPGLNAVKIRKIPGNNHVAVYDIFDPTEKRQQQKFNAVEN
jgi:hypothetical protein